RSFQFFHCLDCVVINTAPRLLTNQSHLTQHVKTVAGQTYFTTFIVIPTNGNLTKPQPRSMCEVEQFNIEPETIHSSCFYKWSAHPHVKCFESTLRVPEGKTCCQSHG